LRFRIEVSTIEQLAEAVGLVEFVYAPANIAYPHERIIAIPPLFTKVDLHGFERICAQTINHFPPGKTLHGGFRLNITNSAALQEYAALGLVDCILSIEISLQRAKGLVKPFPCGFMAYGNLPMMLLRRDPGGDLIDRKGKALPLTAENGEFELLNPDKLILSDRISEFAGLDFAVLKLSPGESPRKVLEMYQNSVKPTGNYTRGLYYK
jgi:putative protease